MSLLSEIIGDLEKSRKQAIKVIGIVIPEIKKLAVAANGEIPTIQADLNDPIIKTIASELPGGSAVLAEATVALNEFAAPIAKAATTNVLNALQVHLISQVTIVFSGTEKKLSEIVGDVARDLGI